MLQESDTNFESFSHFDLATFSARLARVKGSELSLDGGLTTFVELFVNVLCSFAPKAARLWLSFFILSPCTLLPNKLEAIDLCTKIIGGSEG